jgi:uncharacterized protein (DUF849 family)
MKPSDRYSASVLTAAITGGDILPSQSEHLPRGVEAIVAEAIASGEAGATVVHLHGRDDEGRPSADPVLLSEIAAGIRERSDVVINFSTGGSPGMTEAERLRSLEAARPDLGTLNLGTMNYELFPDPARWPDVRTDWERAVVEQSGNGTFVNTLASLRRFAAAFRDLGVAPELEAYDVGHIAMARQLIDEGTLRPPVRVQLVLGVLGGAPNAIETMIALRGEALRILGDDLAGLGVAATGYPMQLRCVATGLALGMDVRVGMEDSLRVTRTRRAESNVEFVQAARRLADTLGRPIAGREQLEEYLEAARQESGAAAAVDGSKRREGRR